MFPIDRPPLVAGEETASLDIETQNKADFKNRLINIFLLGALAFFVFFLGRRKFSILGLGPNQTTVVLTALLIAGGYGFYYYFTEIHEPQKIASDYSLTTGRLIELQSDQDWETSNYTWYEYSVNGKRYTGAVMGEPCHYDHTSAWELMNYPYPIIFSNKNPAKSRLLITPENFERFNIPYPDSLRGMYGSYWECD